MKEITKKLVFWGVIVPLFYMLPPALTGYMIYRHGLEEGMIVVLVLMGVISIILMVLITVAITFQVYPQLREWLSRRRNSIPGG